MMDDREKVINALEDYEPYAREFDSLSVYGWVVLDALALLKEQEPQKVINRYAKWNSVLMGNCPKCNAVLHEFDNAKACGVCGQQVEWK